MRHKLSLAAMLAAALFTLPSLAATQEGMKGGAGRGSGHISGNQGFQKGGQMGGRHAYQGGDHWMGRGYHGYGRYYGGGYWPRHRYWGYGDCWRWTPGGRVWICD